MWNATKKLLALATLADTTQAAGAGYKFDRNCLGANIRWNDNTPMGCWWKGNTINPSKVMFFLHGNYETEEGKTPIMEAIDATNELPNDNILIVYPSSNQKDWEYSNTLNWAWFQGKHKLLGIQSPSNKLFCETPLQGTAIFTQNIEPAENCDINKKELDDKVGPLYNLAKFCKNKVGDWQNMAFGGYSHGGVMVQDLVFGKMKADEAPGSLTLLATSRYDNQESTQVALRKPKPDWKKRTNVRILYPGGDLLFRPQGQCERLMWQNKMFNTDKGNGCESIGPKCTHSIYAHEGDTSCFANVHTVMVEEMRNLKSSGGRRMMLNLRATPAAQARSAIFIDSTAQARSTILLI